MLNRGKREVGELVLIESGIEEVTSNSLFLKKCLPIKKGKKKCLVRGGEMFLQAECRLWTH